jgi:hypothetical protein
MYKKAVKEMGEKIVSQYLSRCLEEVSARVERHKKELNSQKDEATLDLLMGEYLDKYPEGTLHGFKRFVAYQSV